MGHRREQFRPGYPKAAAAVAGVFLLAAACVPRTAAAALDLSTPWATREITIGYAPEEGITFHIPAVDIAAAIESVNGMSAAHLTWANTGADDLSIIGIDYEANAAYRSWSVPVGYDPDLGEAMVLLNTHYTAPTVDDAVRGLVMALGVQDRANPFNGDVGLLVPGLVTLYGVPEPGGLACIGFALAVWGLTRRPMPRLGHRPVYGVPQPRRPRRVSLG
jgi:hypothetical protein